MEPTLLGISGIRMGQPSHVSSISSYPRHPGVPHPSLIALWDPHHSHGPPSTLLSGCAASVTHLGRLPLALCLTGFMVLQSKAQMLCAAPPIPDVRGHTPSPYAVSILESGALSGLLDSVQAPNRVHRQHLAHGRCSVNAVNEPVSERVCRPGATDHPFQDGPAVCDCSISGFRGILYGVLWPRCISACLWVCS